MASPAQNPLSRDQWHRVRELFEKCVELSAQEREAYLSSTAGAEEWLVGEVRALLKAAESATMSTRSTIQEGATIHEQKLPIICDRYLLVERIATGGMAEVYRGKLQGAGGFQREVAVKRIRPRFLDHQELRVLFEEEAKLSASLHHANIVQVYDFMAFEGGYLLAMELVRGVNALRVTKALRERNEVLLDTIGFYLVYEALQGLEYAHSLKDPETGAPLKLVHRDISTKNLMLGDDGSVKIIDFGIAKTNFSLDNTKTGQIRGTIQFMSPEQASGLPLDRRTDLFSMGVILYELYSGLPLFSGDTPLRVLQQISRCRQTVTAKVGRLNASREMKDLLLTAIAEKPEDRFQSAREFADALRRVKPLSLENSRRQLSTLVRQLQRSQSTPQRLPNVKKRSTDPGDSERSALHVRMARGAALSLFMALGAVGIVLFLRGFRAAEMLIGVNSRPPTAAMAPKPSPVTPPKVEPASIPTPAPARKPATGSCRIRIETNPPGAQIRIDGVKRAFTPSTIPVSCRESISIKLTKSGYRSFTGDFYVESEESQLSQDLTKK